MDNSAASDISIGHAGQTLALGSGFDLCYLVEASEDDLGIPPIPYLNCKDEFCQFPKKTSEGLWEIPDLQYLGENWPFEGDFENYQHVAAYENVWYASQHYIRNLTCPAMLFDADLPAPCRLESGSGM